MMDLKQHTADVLNDLLAIETGCILARLPELELFASAGHVADLAAFQRLAKDAQEHRAWLADAIACCHESPLPVSMDPMTASLHYVSVDSLAPRILGCLEHLIDVYHAAAAGALTPEGQQLVARISERYQAHLEALSKHNESAVPHPA